MKLIKTKKETTKKLKKFALSEKEIELIEVIRNYKNARHNPSRELEYFARQVFENFLYDYD